MFRLKRRAGIIWIIRKQPCLWWRGRYSTRGCWKFSPRNEKCKNLFLWNQPRKFLSTLSVSFQMYLCQWNTVNNVFYASCICLIKRVLQTCHKKWEKNSFFVFKGKVSWFGMNIFIASTCPCIWYTQRTHRILTEYSAIQNRASYTVSLSSTATTLKSVVTEYKIAWTWILCAPNSLFLLMYISR